MTAITETPQPGTASPGPVVRLRLSEETIVRGLLQLPDGVRLAGASIDGYAGPPALTLYLEYPGAPGDADEVIPVYTQRYCPGHAERTGETWARQGRVLGG